MHTTAQFSIDDLRAQLEGPVIGPDDPDYDAARGVVLRSIDRRPAAIVRPVDAGEVSHVVSLARETGVELAVRAGGHSYAGHSTRREASCSTCASSPRSRSTRTTASFARAAGSTAGRCHDCGRGTRPCGRLRRHADRRDRRSHARRRRRLPRTQARPDDRPAARRRGRDGRRPRPRRRRDARARPVLGDPRRRRQLRRRDALRLPAAPGGHGHGRDARDPRVRRRRSPGSSRSRTRRRRSCR